MLILNTFLALCSFVDCMLFLFNSRNPLFEALANLMIVPVLFTGLYYVIFKYNLSCSPFKKD